MDDDPHDENSCEEGSKAVSSDEKRICSICFKIVYSNGNMKAHFKKHHEREKRFECMVRQRSFSAKISLEYLIRKTHSDSGEVSCDRC